MKTTIVGLTGGIGSGKTTVSDYLSQQGIPIVDTDIIAREVVKKGSHGLQQLVALFGESCLNADGTLNRAYLRSKIFAEPALRKQLEAITHPLINTQVQTELSNLVKQSIPLIIVVIPLLTESILKGKQYDYLDQLWVVDAPESSQLERVQSRDANSREQIEKIMTAQASREQRLQIADVIIENNHNLSDLYSQLDSLLKSYL